MKRIIIINVFITLLLTSITFAQELPETYYQFRDDMYNYSKSPLELEVDYQNYMNHLPKQLSGYKLFLAQSRFEFIMGRVWFYQQEKQKAAFHYDKGVEYATLAIKENDCAQSELIYAENISANCAVKPVNYALTWGIKISGLTDKVLEYDKKNGAALYMQNAQNIYAPAPFNNITKGIQQMKNLLNNSNVNLDKDDKFNVISSIGYGYIELKQYIEAKKWLTTSLEIYPTNQYVQSLIAICDKGISNEL